MDLDKDWCDMTYDEQRALLGLKDVRADLAREAMNRQAQLVVQQFRVVSEALAVTVAEIWAAVEADIRVAFQGFGK